MSHIGVKGPREESKLRVEAVIELLASGAHPHEMRKAIKAKWGVGHRQADRYLRLARQRATEALKADKDALVADSYNRYLAIATDPKAKHRDRIDAQVQIDRLLGLSAPYKLAPTTPDGESSWQQEKPDTIRDMLLNRLVPSQQ